MVKNIADIYESGFSTDKSDETDNFSLPIFATFGYSTQYNDFLLSFDNELIYGHYGGTESNKATFWFIRAGVEKKYNELLTFRCGLTIPVKARTDTLGNIRNDLPWPKIGGAVGVSICFDRFKFDFSIYGDPARSYVDQEIRIKAVGSLTITL